VAVPRLCVDKRVNCLGTVALFQPHDLRSCRCEGLYAHLQCDRPRRPLKRDFARLSSQFGPRSLAPICRGARKLSPGLHLPRQSGPDWRLISAGRCVTRPRTEVQPSPFNLFILHEGLCKARGHAKLSSPDAVRTPKRQSHRKKVHRSPRFGSHPTPASPIFAASESFLQFPQMHYATFFRSIRRATAICMVITHYRTFPVP
jgi:hypothetical protein